MKVLLIDDDDDVRRIARLSLTRVGGLEVRDEASGRRGIAAAAEERPDLILLDVMMPSLDGPSTLSELRANPATAAVPIVFLTAKAMTAELERLRRLGALGVIVKPFDPMTLPQQVKALMENG